MSSHRTTNKPHRRRRKKLVKRNETVGWSARFRNGIKRYWFVAVPALLVNVAFTIDHVIAKNNQDVYRVRIKQYVRMAEDASPSVQDDVPLSETLQAHWISTNDDGNLEGRISAIELSDLTSMPIEKLDVALLKKGEKIRIATTDNDGRFTLQTVSPGVYTLVASGQNGFLAYGVNVLPNLKAFDVLDQKTELQRNELKRAYYVSVFNLPQDAVVEETLQIDAAAVPPEFTTLQRICRNYLPTTAELTVELDRDDAKAIGKATSIRSGFQHTLTADGKLEGKIQPIATSDGQSAKLSDMNIFLIQYDVEAARVAVEESGRFTIEDVEPGVYSLVAAGKDGFAALSLELIGVLGEGENVDDVQSTALESEKVHYVSNHAVEPGATGANVNGMLGVAIITDPQDLCEIREEVDRVSEERRRALLAMQGQEGAVAGQGGFAQGGFGQAPYSQGGFGGTGGTGGYGGTGGGYGGAGGGGGIVGGRSGLWAIAGIGLAAAAASSNNDDTNDNPPPMSGPPVFDPPPASQVQ